jgi:16S rRNA (cytidine1402-2'-O)-methyltransferase
MGILYIVSTPIGNLGDITYRAVEVLKSVDLIACEDTRKTKILTNHYGITTHLTSYYEYNKVSKGDYLLKTLKEGKRVALVSDAGTPGISDPGFTLIKSVLAAGIKVVSVPGATALISALSISGFPTHNFFFEGFLPAKSGARKKRLAALKGLDVTVVIYESPHRLLKTLEDMNSILGSSKVAIVREITKKFEEALWATPLELIERFEASKPRGEFVIIF